MTHSSALAAKVAAVNRAHSEANRLFPMLAAVFAPLVGQKLTKADGTLLESVKKLVPELPNWSTGDKRVNAYLTTGHGYSLSLSITARADYETGRGYQSGEQEAITVYIADLTAPEGAPFGAARQYVKSIYPDHGPRRTDWTVEEVARLREEVKQAEDALSRAKSALYPFADYHGRG